MQIVDLKLYMIYEFQLYRNIRCCSLRSTACSWHYPISFSVKYFYTYIGSWYILSSIRCNEPTSNVVMHSQTMMKSPRVWEFVSFALILALLHVPNQKLSSSDIFFTNGKRNLIFVFCLFPADFKLLLFHSLFYYIQLFTSY